MSGRFKGVQARLKERCPDSVYVHCANHSLDLVLQEAAKGIEYGGRYHDLRARCD